MKFASLGMTRNPMSDNAFATRSRSAARVAISHARCSSVSHVASAGPPAGSRTVTRNVDPRPSSLTTSTSPSIIRHSLRTITRPRPVPPYRRDIEPSAWVNAWNRRSSASREIPIPVSVTSICSARWSPVASRSDTLTIT